MGKHPTCGNYRPRNINFQGNEGLQIPIRQDAEAIDYLNLYLTDAVIDKLVTETNRYAEQYLNAHRNNLPPKSILHYWEETNADEMRCFLGVYILMGIIHKPRVWMYWSTDQFYSTPVFGQIMVRRRFQLLLRFFHFQNNEDPTYNPQDPLRDRLFKIREVMDMMKERFNTVYYPDEHITVDESLVLYKGRWLFKQYIKTKRDRFGIKFYELASSDGTLLDFIIYQGNIQETLIHPPGEDWLQTERIPLTLINP